MTQPLTPWQPSSFNLTALAQPRQTPAARRPPPATAATGPAKPPRVPPARAPRPTLPLATPIEAPALDHLFGATTTRRAAWNTLVGNKRTNALVDYAANYRKANPTMFQGVFDGGTIDTPVNMRRLDQNGFAAMIRKQEPGRTPAASQAKAATTGGIMYTARNPHDMSFGAVRTGMGMDMSTLLHELSHTGTPTSNLTASGKPSGRPGVLATPTPEYLDTLFKQHPTNPTGRAAQRLTDATYSADLTTRPNEIGSQIISMKAHLEQQGVDTTSPDAIYRALKNPDHFKDAAFEPTKMSRNLQLLADPRYGIPPEDYDKGLKAIADLMPGIAKTTTPTQYKTASAAPTTLEGIHMLALLHTW